MTGMAVDIAWEPFFLNRHTPAEGEDLREHIKNKYGPKVAEDFMRPDNHLSVAGSKVGISFNNSRRIIRTRDSHRLVEFVKREVPAKEDELMERMFKAYFQDAADLSQRDQLLQVTEACGIDTARASRMLDSDEFVQDVDSKVSNWSRKGVSGVPFFIFPPESEGARPVSFSGAQPPDVMEEARTAARMDACMRKHTRADKSARARTRAPTHPSPMPPRSHAHRCCSNTTEPRLDLP